MDLELEYEAFKFANKKHEGQVRKYTGEPYIFHPIRVALHASEYRKLYPPIVAAAFLHDTIEDCGVSAKTIENLFGKDVCDIVVGLTEYCDQNPQYKTLPRRDRHELNICYLAVQPPVVQTLKGLDRYCNLLDSPLHSVECVSFLRRKYLKESWDIANLVQDVDNNLYLKLVALIKDLEEKVK